ncbi:MAG TPA: hypothetical protein DCS93_31200 [Microscillaceae bacterium]|nr:hypothetical protein [Microscillaceae bacterium]
MRKHTTISLLFLVLLSSLLMSTTLVLNIKPQEKLLYISKRGAGFDIYKNTLNGQNETQLTTLEGWEWQTQYIKKLGKQRHLILFNSQNKKEGFRMRAMDRQGNPVNLNTKGLPAFDMSPNGQWVVYNRKQGKATHIILVPFAHPQDSIQITSGRHYHGRMKWSPDSRRISFISDKSGSNEIYVYRLKSKKTERITNNQVREKYCTWAPNGRQIITSMQKGKANNDLFLIDLKTRQTMRLTDTPSIHESEIAWSPSGKYVAYHAKVAGKDDIFLLTLKTKKVTKITQGQGYHGEPGWIVE